MKLQHHLASLLPAFLLGALLGTPASAQLTYELEFDTRDQEWVVAGSFENPSGEDVEFWFPRWTPGAYHVADYGKLVERVQAFDGKGKQLKVERVDDSLRRIAAAGATSIEVRYRAPSQSDSIWSNGVIDVESNRIQRDYAYVTPVSLFGFLPDRADEPVELTVDLPRGWKVATAMEEVRKNRFRAPSFLRFEDSPLFFSNELETFTFDLNGMELSVSIHGLSRSRAKELASHCVKITEAAGRLFGGFPFDHYHFLLGFVPQGMGSGLEHSYSTLILLNPGLPVDGEGVLGIIAHELVHAWCAERIHVQEIREPDLTRPLETETLWVNESFTEYMAQHVLLHAGFIDEERFIELLTEPLPDQLYGMAGPPTEVSREASGWGGMQDLMRWSMTAYVVGRRKAFALDLEMRRASDGELGLIDLLRHLMKEYADEGRGFPEGGTIKIASELVGEDLAWFHKRYIASAEPPDLPGALEVIGYAWKSSRAQEARKPTAQQLAAREDLFSIPGSTE